MGCIHTLPNCDPCQLCCYTAPELVFPDCPDGEPCPEAIGAECVIWNGMDLSCTGIEKTDRLSDVLLGMIAELYPDCMTTTTTTTTTTIPA